MYDDNPTQPERPTSPIDEEINRIFQVLEVLGIRVNDITDRVRTVSLPEADSLVADGVDPTVRVSHSDTGRRLSDVYGAVEDISTKLMRTISRLEI